MKQRAFFLVVNILYEKHIKVVFLYDNTLFHITVYKAEILYTGGVTMAQVSIQYALDHVVDQRDAKRIQRELNQYAGVNHVTLNQDNGILCVDYDDSAMKQAQLEQSLSRLNYTYAMIDSIIFLR